MNFEAEVVRVIQDNNFDDFTKIRYIYRAVCAKFSYDVRMTIGNFDLKREVYNKKIDLTNVKEFEIACYTYCRIIVDLLSIFGIRAEIVRESRGQFPHAYVIVNHKGMVLKLDPTKKHDTTRVKMGLPTYDFTTEVDDSSFSDNVEEADSNIRSVIKRTYENQFYDFSEINKIASIMINDVKSGSVSPEDSFYLRLNTIINLVNTRYDFVSYDDIDYYLDYLIKKFNMNYNYRFNEEEVFIRPAVFYVADEDKDPEMRDIINIILVDFNGLHSCYIMENVDGHYQIKSLPFDKLDEKLEKYTNSSVFYYFQKWASDVKKSSSFRY